MSEERGFGQFFSREVEAILAVYDRGLIFDHEARQNLRLAGVLIAEQVEMPPFTPPEPVEHDAGDWQPEPQEEMSHVGR